MVGIRGDGIDDGGRRAVRIGRLALGLTLVPLVVSAVHLTFGVGGDYHPASDLATTEMLVRDVGHRAVLLGPYSRDGWHHPGPMASYLFAVPYRLLGSTSTALDVAALALNGVAIAGMAIVARRRGGLPLQLVTLLGCALVMRALDADVVRLPWNPYVTVLPYGALVFLTWALACRDRWALPVAVAVATFLAQTHVGYVALAGPLLALGTGALLWSTARATDAGDTIRERMRPLVAPVAVSVAIGAALWAPPIYDQLTREPGNLREIVQFFQDGGTAGEEAQGWRRGWRLVTAQYAPAPEWVAGTAPNAPFTAEPDYLYSPQVPVLLLLVGAALVVLVRRRAPGARSLAIVWVAASAAGIAATARVVGAAFAYRNGWAWMLGMVGGIAVLWAAWDLVARRWPDAPRRALVPGVVVGIAALAVAASVGQVRAGVPEANLSEQIRTVTPEVVDALPPGDGQVVVDGRSSWGGLVQGPSLILALERRGVDARFPTQTSAGPQRVADEGPARAQLVLVTGEDVPAAIDQPGFELLAYAGDVDEPTLRARVARGDVIEDAEALAVLVRLDA